MSRRWSLILVGGIVAGLWLVIYLVQSRATPTAPRPPELGGQQVPARLLEIRFDQQYDLFCSFYSEEPTVYRNVKILGFTGRGEEGAGSGRVSRSSVFSSYSGSAATHFDHWLVLELPDGRLAYIPPHAVKYIEQAAPPGK